MINDIIGIITDTMPKDENGKIIDKQLHSDLITAIQLAKNLHQPNVIKSACEHDLIKIKNRTVEICKKCGKPWILG